MSDEWDDLILQKQPAPNGKTNLATQLPKEIFAGEGEETKWLPGSKDRTSRPQPPTSKTPLPYVSKLPVLWSANWASKFAALALALSLSFGIYSYANHISRLGLTVTLSGTINSLQAKFTRIFPGSAGNSVPGIAAPAVLFLKD